MQVKKISNICLDLDVDLGWVSAKGKIKANGELIRKLIRTYTSSKGHLSQDPYAFLNKQQIVDLVSYCRHGIWILGLQVFAYLLPMLAWTNIHFISSYAPALQKEPKILYFMLLSACCSMYTICRCYLLYLNIIFVLCCIERLILVSIFKNICVQLGRGSKECLQRICSFWMNLTILICWRLRPILV